MHAGLSNTAIPRRSNLPPGDALAWLVGRQHPATVGWIFFGRWLFLDRSQDAEILADGRKLLAWIDRDVLGFPAGVVEPVSQLGFHQLAVSAFRRTFKESPAEPDTTEDERGEPRFLALDEARQDRFFQQLRRQQPLREDEVVQFTRAELAAHRAFDFRPELAKPGVAVRGTSVA